MDQVLVLFQKTELWVHSGVFRKVFGLIFGWLAKVERPPKKRDKGRVPVVVYTSTYCDAFVIQKFANGASNVDNVECSFHSLSFRVADQGEVTGGIESEGGERWRGRRSERDGEEEEFCEKKKNWFFYGWMVAGLGA